MLNSIELENDPLYKIRHSAAHVMAQAVVELYPDANLAIGPPIENRFYYDFDLGTDEDGTPRSFSLDDLAKIEKRMRQIVAGNHTFTYREVSADEATALTNALSEHWHVSSSTASDVAGVILNHFVTKDELTDYCQRFVENHDEEDVSKLFFLLLDVVKSDGKVALEENVMLSHIAENLGFDAAFVEQSIKRLG